MARNLPRGWVLPDAAIYELAAARPRTREALARMAEVPAGTAARAADELLGAIAAAPGAAGVRGFADTERPGPEQLKLQKALQARLAEIAAALDIQPEVLATRRELAALARGARELPVLRGWRREAVGEKLLAAI
jgi:ribonuclease D